MRHGIPFLAAAICVSLLTAPAIAQVSLQWKFKEGARFFAEETTNVKQTTTVMNKVQEKHEIQYTLVSFFVEKVTPEHVVLVQTIEELKNELLKGDPQPEDEEVLKKMKGSKFTITLNTSGQITRFEGYDALVNKLSDGDDNIARAFRAILPKEALQKIAEGSFAWSPTKAVKKGDTWQRISQIPLGPLGSLKANQKFTYAGKQKDLDVVGLVSELTYLPAKKDNPDVPFKIIRGDLKAEKATGTILFDPKLGRPTQESAAITLRGKMTVEVLNMEIEVELYQEQTMVTRISATRPKVK